MSTLHLFGDSFTEGHRLDQTYPPYQEWRKYRNDNLPPCWGDLLSKELNMTMKNHAVGGMSNSEIFQSICRHSHTFEKDDIVIINWTYPNRFRWAYWCKKQRIYKWVRLSLNPEDGSKILEETRNEIALNKTISLYIDEVYEKENLILEYSKSKKFKVFFWSADIDIINNLPSKKLNDRKYILHKEIDELPLNIVGEHIHIARSEMRRTIFDVFFKYGGVTISEETNGNVMDNHLGEKGHVVQFELFYKYLTENSII
jgi:hypothetical protein